MKKLRGVWKHPKTENWIARYRNAEGMWINRSTGTREGEEAERVAAQWKIEAERERAQKLGPISPAGISDTIARAERLARGGRLDAHAARDLVNELLAAAGLDAVDAVTNRAWCETWRASKAGAVKDRSNWKYEQVSREWLEFLGGKGDKPLEAVSRADVIAYRDQMAKEGLSARTVNQTVKLLRGIYAEAVEQGHLGRNPFAGVDGLREDDEDAGRKLPFTTREVSALIKTAEGDWKGLVILDATTGLRLLDAARLKWSNLDLGRGLIRVKTMKRGVTLTLPIHPTFRKWLAKQTRGIGAAPIFPSLANKGGAGKSGLSMAFKRLMERAGIEAGVARVAQENSRGRTTSQKSFHSLRHFAATQLASNGVRDDIARAITGHADAVTHSNYVTADAATKLAAVKTIRLSV